MYTRRELFFRSLNLIVVLPLGASLFGSACSSSSSDDCKTAGAVSSTADALTVTSSCNGGHDHDFAVMTTDLTSPPAAGVMGESTPYEDDGHTHTVALTMAQLQQIEAGQSVTVTSGLSLGHTHTFTFHT
jgi:hypothetical protein